MQLKNTSLQKLKPWFCCKSWHIRISSWMKRGSIILNINQVSLKKKTSVNFNNEKHLYCQRNIIMSNSLLKKLWRFHVISNPFHANTQIYFTLTASRNSAVLVAEYWQALKQDGKLEQNVLIKFLLKNSEKFLKSGEI